MKWAFHPALLALSVAWLPCVAPADIVQWTDHAGVTHYTNLTSEVPADDQASVKVVVDESTRQRPAAGEASTAPAPYQPSQGRLAEAIYDRSQWLNAYLEGLQRGLQIGGAAGAGGAVQINGPLVVTTSGTVPYYDYAGPYFYRYGWPYFYPGVAVFDHARFRHLGRFRERPFVLGRIRTFGRFPGVHRHLRGW